MSAPEVTVPPPAPTLPESLPRPGNITTPYFSRSQIVGRHDQRRPDSFAQEFGLRQDIEFEHLELAEREKEKVRKIAEVLNHPALTALIAEGKITVAMVKPNVNKGRSEASDEEIASQILTTEVKPPLEVVFSLPVWMTPGDVDHFYASVKAQLVAMRDDRGSVWDRYKKYMTDGAVTFALLYSAEGNAVPEWRRQMGPTNPAKDTTGESIRARYGFSTEMNVVHGSSGDTPEERAANVTYESGWMRAKLGKILDAPHAGPNDLLNEEALRDCNVLREGEVFLGVEQFLQEQHVKAEGADFAGYIVTLIDVKGRIVRRRFVTKDSPVGQDMKPEMNRIATFKALVKEHGGALSERAEAGSSIEDALQRAVNRSMPKTGLAAPTIYHMGARSDGRSRLVRDYVADHNREMQTLVSNPEWDIGMRKQSLRGLINVAALLDTLGIPSKRLGDSFIFDGTKYVYIGSDTIEFDKRTPDTDLSSALADILNTYGQDEVINEYIRGQYEVVRTAIREQRLPSPQGE